MTTSLRRSLSGLGLAAALGLTASARADFITYTLSLSGPAESPTNNSPGIGNAVIDVDTIAHTMRVRLTFSGLTGGTTASHIHAATPLPFSGTAGVATQTPTFAGLPLGVTSGSMDQTLDMTLASSYNPSYITANGGTPATAEAALFGAMAQGRAYLNVHTSAFPGGEIRGFIPAPGVGVMLGLAGLAALRRRR